MSVSSGATAVATSTNVTSGRQHGAAKRGNPLRWEGRSPSQMFPAEIRKTGLCGTGSGRLLRSCSTSDHAVSGTTGGVLQRGHHRAHGRAHDQHEARVAVGTGATVAATSTASASTSAGLLLNAGAGKSGGCERRRD